MPDIRPPKFFSGIFKLLLPGCVFLAFALHVSGQSRREIQGVVKDTTGMSLPGASVKLTSLSDTLSTATDVNGKFRFPAVKATKFKITASSIGFLVFTRDYSIDEKAGTVTLSPIHLKDAYNQLNEVVITAVTPVVVKEDTVQYDASAYPVREGDAVGEMVKRLPGMEVDKAGNVKVEGQPVVKIRLNGKDFFGNDATSALQNLPADIVKNIQVVDDYGDEANITGIKSGDPQKILNINTRDDKKHGYYGRANGGLGSTDRYSGRVRGTHFTDNRQLAVEAANNNTSGSSRGSTETSMARVNYRAKWGKKIDSYGSYQFNRNDNKYTELKNTQNIFDSYTRYDSENSNNQRKDYDHSLSWNLEYAIDSSNYLKIKPDFSYSSSNNISSGLTNTQLRAASSEKLRLATSASSAFNGGAELYFNHKFAHKGRNLAFNAVIDVRNGDGTSDQRNDYTDTDSAGNLSMEKQYQYRDNDNSNSNSRLRVSYIEPLSEKSFVEVNYQWSRTSTNTTRTIFDINPSSGDRTLNKKLGNDYNYQFITNRAGLNFRHISTKLNYFAGVAVMPAVLKGQDLSRDNVTQKNTLNWIPAARLVYKFSKKQTFTARYNGRSNQPGFAQLQPVTDNSDLRNITTGNPDLKPEFTNSLSMEYKQTDWGSGYIFNSGLEFSKTNDKIVTTKVIIPDSLKQVTSYINTDGFYNGQFRYSFSKPFSERRFTITYSGGSNYSNNIAFTNNERTTGKNLVLNQRLRFRLDIPDVMNAELSTSYSYNQTRYSSSSYSDRNTNRYNIGLEGRNYFFEDLSVGYDFSKEINKGYSSGNANPTLLNLFLDYRFLKGNRASIRLQGYDLFNQNTGISRDVFDNVIVDSRSNRLSRYFMLSFQYRIQKFGA